MPFNFKRKTFQTVRVHCAWADYYTTVDKSVQFLERALLSSLGNFLYLDIYIVKSLTVTIESSSWNIKMKHKMSAIAEIDIRIRFPQNSIKFFHYITLFDNEYGHIIHVKNRSCFKSA